MPVSVVLRVQFAQLADISSRTNIRFYWPRERCSTAENTEYRRRWLLLDPEGESKVDYAVTRPGQSLNNPPFSYSREIWRVETMIASGKACNGPVSLCDPPSRSCILGPPPAALIPDILLSRHSCRLSLSLHHFCIPP